MAGGKRDDEAGSVDTARDGQSLQTSRLCFVGVVVLVYLDGVVEA